MSDNEAGGGWHAPTPQLHRNYPYNCWWVGAFSNEVGRDLLGRWLLDTPVLLYRRENGEAVAIENRCPHRAGRGEMLSGGARTRQIWPGSGNSCLTGAVDLCIGPCCVAKVIPWQI